MEYTIKMSPSNTQRSDCLIVGVFEKNELSPSAELIDISSKRYLKKILNRGDFTGKFGQTLLLQDVPNLQSKRLLLLGCGKKEEFNDFQFRKAISRAIGVINTTQAKDIVIYLTELALKDRNNPWKIKQSVECIEDTLYSFNQLKSKKENSKKKPDKIQFFVNNKEDVSECYIALKQGLAIANGMGLVKNLGNLPANICTPTYLAEQATQLSKQFKTIKTQVLNIEACKKLGMGAFASVAKGSHEPAKLIILEYRGAKTTEKPIALVGKGITFDSGGISIKLAVAMDEMKYDMCGGATVLGTIKAAAELKLLLNIVGVVPATENMPGGHATKPGDIVTTLSGQTVEILNTDAEGRLILCDALSYCEKFKPEIVIDIATLTYATIIALGNLPSAIMSNNQELTNELLSASAKSCDRLWQMPLWEEYQEPLSSNFADMANLGGREAGAITAASFLSRFTKKYRWAHLDIAGTAWRSGKDKGATGRPVPLLVQFLLDKCGE